jgi:hypothetical protein
MLLEVFARFDIVGPLQVYFALLSLEGIVGTKDVGQNLTAVLMSRVTCDIARNTSALQSKRLLCSAASRVSTSKFFQPGAAKAWFGSSRFLPVRPIASACGPIATDSAHATRIFVVHAKGRGLVIATLCVRIRRGPICLAP